MAQKQEEEEKVRLDKWLWAARFFKTRALAKAAIESGRCKPGKEPRVGDELQIRTGFEPLEFLALKNVATLPLNPFNA